CVSDDPDQNGQDNRAGHGQLGPALGRGNVEAQSGIPEQMADATKQVIAKGEGQTEQNDAADQAAKQPLGSGEGVRPAGKRDQPVHQQQAADSQRASANAVQDGWNPSPLRLVDLQMRRKRPVFALHFLLRSTLGPIRRGDKLNSHAPRCKQSSQPRRRATLAGESSRSHAASQQASVRQSVPGGRPDAIVIVNASEVDTAAVLLPVAEAGRLRTVATAYFLGQRRLLLGFGSI